MKNTMNIDFELIEANEKRADSRSSFRKVITIAGFLISAVWIIPYYYLFVSVLKSTEEYNTSHPLSLPDGVLPIIENSMQAWAQAKMSTGAVNSIFYGVVGAGIAIFLAAMAAYALTRFEFKSRNIVFLLIFSGVVFPFQMYLVPIFFMYSKIGFINTHFGMLLFYIAITVSFPTLILRTYMQGITHEVDEAAKLDGASHFTTFLRIILPQCWPPIAALFLLQFTFIWNDLIFSIVLGNQIETRSIMNSIQVLQGSYAITGPNVILTSALIASIPSLVLFLLLRKKFMSGLVAGTA